MLDRAHRLTSGQAFLAAVRGGARSGGSAVVVHLLRPETAASGSARVGLVVGKSIGNAVERNRVKRRLRHLARERLPLLPESSVLVIRAQPGAATASSSVLGNELDRGIRRALQRGARR
jgi:ribonuclease P protein component